MQIRLYGKWEANCKKMEKAAVKNSGFLPSDQLLVLTSTKRHQVYHGSNMIRKSTY